MYKLKNVWIYLYFRIENDGECYIYKKDIGI